MNLETAKRLYMAAGGPSDHDAAEWDEIRVEMEAVVAAKSDRAAAKVIEWWGCWDPRYTATAFARRVRQEHERNEEE
jgi:hypothetical protein